MDLSTSGSSSSEDEDDDCVITLVRPGQSDAKPSGLRGDSLSLLGVKKERAENGNLYVFLDVKEDVPDGSLCLDALVDDEECVDGDLDLEMPEDGPQKPVDLTPFLSYLSSCINESRTTEVSSVKSEDDFAGGVEPVEIHFDSASCVGTERDVSDEKTHVLCVPKESSSGVGAPPDLMSASATLASCEIAQGEMANPLCSPEKFDQGTQAMEVDPVSASAAPLEAGDEENGIEDECYDGSEGNGFHGCELDGFEADRFAHQQQEAFAQEQQECVQIEEKADGEETQEQLQELAQTLTSPEDSEACREFSPSNPEVDAMALAKISNTDFRVEAMKAISPTSAAVTDTVVGTNEASKAGTRKLLSHQSMFSWCGMQCKKFPSERAAFQKPSEKFDLRKLHESPCSSQSYEPLGSSKGSESNNPRRGLKAKELVLASSSCNSIGEEDGSEKYEGSPLGVSTPLQIHHLKGAPRKCRALRRVVSPFEYEQSWKGLMPSNGQFPQKERQKVIQALYTFEELRAHLRESEELRVAKGRAEGIACRERPDLKACTEMRLRGLQVNTNEYIGNVPGVFVGDRFWYRIEMVVIGLHKQLEAGIAFISRMKSQSGIPVATSIVMKHSGNPYRDDRDDGEFITYTGQGGLSTRSGAAHCVANQVLTRGNEALKNSYEGHLPIRVIRGEKDKRSPTGDVYTYIGLYLILGMRYEPGKDGNLVYMFDLQRQGGQHPLPICASKPVVQITNKAGPSKSISLKRKWDNSPEFGDASRPCSSKEQWGIPVNFSNVNQALYVRGS